MMLARRVMPVACVSIFIKMTAPCAKRTRLCARRALFAISRACLSTEKKLSSGLAAKNSAPPMNSSDSTSTRMQKR